MNEWIKEFSSYINNKTKIEYYRNKIIEKQLNSYEEIVNNLGTPLDVAKFEGYDRNNSKTSRKYKNISVEEIMPNTKEKIKDISKNFEKNRSFIERVFSKTVMAVSIILISIWTTLILIFGFLFALLHFLPKYDNVSVWVSSIGYIYIILIFLIWLVCSILIFKNNKKFYKSKDNNKKYPAKKQILIVIFTIVLTFFTVAFRYVLVNEVLYTDIKKEISTNEKSKNENIKRLGEKLLLQSNHLEFFEPGNHYDIRFNFNEKLKEEQRQSQQETNILKREREAELKQRIDDLKRQKEELDREINDAKNDF